MPGVADYRFLVSQGDMGLRLDSFLSAKIDGLSRSQAARLVRQGHALVDGSPKKPSHQLAPGQAVTASLPKPEPCQALPEALEIDILYQDSDLVVVNKPPGLVVHPAPGHISGTLVNALLHHCRDLSGVGGLLRPGIVHRLDKDTSGVLVAAKNDAAHQALSGQFAARTVEKTYLALVFGVPEKDSGIVDMPVGRHPDQRKKMAAGKGRQALTLWRVARRFADAALLEIDIHTGRTHQIRVHLAALGHPVIGDSVYAGKKRGKKLPDSVAGKTPFPGRQMLHAFRLSLILPASGKRLVIEAPVPQDMQILTQALEKAAENRWEGGKIHV
ncbi:MAG: RluA family pseudouridine synthase [Desulfatibacillaceae bacterium]|nr:RluA family pseudouridine synthase [Desulfatibacillaceae bacterium]